MNDLIEKMRKFMYENNGIGLAANQIDRPEKVFIIHKVLVEKHGIPEVFTNPQIVRKSDYQQEDVEGCLSYPGKQVRVKRAYSVTLKSDEGEFRAKALLARVFQHEVDHLTGKCILDYTLKANE